MQPVLTAQSVRAAEQRWAMDNGGSTWPLMQAAATSFVRQYLERFRGRSVLIVAGTGNNGGDGYCIARLLREAGIAADVIAPLGRPKPGIDADRALQAFVKECGAVLSDWPERSPDCVVDALFGSGLNRDLNEAAQRIIRKMNASDAPIFAVDIPSGLNADTGRIMPVAVHAKATHSFIALKPGQLTGEGPECCGQLSIDSLRVAVQSDWTYQPRVIRLPGRRGATHKAQHGNVHVVGGRLGMGGAAVIASSAALNAGAGRVISHCDPEFVTATLNQNPEIMTQPGLPDVRAENAVWLIGPGLGRDEAARNQVAFHLQDDLSKGVLDADALHLIPERQRPLSGWVLTPHEGEAAALLGCGSKQISEDRPAAAVALSRRFQTVVVLKGAGTLVAAPDGLVFCHPGSPAMATPGMGDCLAGIIVSLMAQGDSAQQAAVTGVNWHARLGRHLAERQRLVLATDMLPLLKTRLEP